MATLALSGSGGVEPRRRGAGAVRYVDLVLLAAALPVFVAAELPLAGYLVLAAVWLAQLGIERLAEARAGRALAEGDRRTAMGWIGGTTLARVWLVALAVLLVGLSEREAGLAAAVLAAILFTAHLLGRLISGWLAPEEAR